MKILKSAFNVNTKTGIFKNLRGENTTSFTIGATGKILRYFKKEKRSTIKKFDRLYSTQTMNLIAG